LALQSTLYRFKIDLSDIDRSLYEAIDVRMAMHPSETQAFLITRLLAYVLNFQTGLEFSTQGLGDSDQPPLSVVDPRGGLLLWIEIGNPSAKRVHMASKASKKLKIYTYKENRTWFDELKAAQIFQFDKIEIRSFKAELLAQLASQLERNNEWSIICHDGSITINTKSDSVVF
jgi:uncharacterized protein YaeQ